MIFQCRQDLKKQVLFLDNNPDVALLGSWVEEIDSAGNIVSFRSFLTDPPLLRWRLFLCNSFVHSSVMYRKSAVVELAGYSDEFPYAEDYDLWSRISFNWDLANFPEVLVRWRCWDENCSAVKGHTQFRQAGLIAKRNVKTVWPEVRDDQVEVLRTLYQRDRGAVRQGIENLMANLDIFLEKYCQRFNDKVDIRYLEIEITTHIFSAIQHSAVTAVDKVVLFYKLIRKMKPNIFRIIAVFLFKRTLTGRAMARFVGF